MEIFESNDSFLQKSVFDIVFVGGGPSTLSYLCNLFQNNLHHNTFKYSNILVIEKSDSFGSGCLGKYGMRTNTTSEGFLRLIYRPIKPNGNIMNENICEAEKASSNKASVYKENERKGSEEGNTNYRTNPIECFKVKQDEKAEEERDNPSDKHDEAYHLNFDDNGDKRPQKLLPDFVQFFSTTICQEIKRIGPDFTPLLTLGEYLSALGDYIIKLVKQKFNKDLVLKNSQVMDIKKISKSEFRISVKSLNSNAPIYHIKSKNIVMATGGVPKQCKYSVTEKDICTIAADHVLTEPGYISFLDNILRLIENCPDKPKIKTVILGGSHSTFSLLWIIFNGPCSCKTIHLPGEKCFDWKSYKSHKLFTLKKSKDDPAFAVSEFLDITVCHRSIIKVSYPSVEEANKDGYKTYDKKCMNSKGKIYPFVGIRADAKEIFRNFLNKKENRIKFIQTATEREQDSIVRMSDILLYALGYKTQEVTFFNLKNMSLLFNSGKFRDEPYVVNNQLNLISPESITYENVYGIGQGYSINAPEIVNGKRIRADSVFLYNSVTSKKLAKAFLGMYMKNKRDKKESNAEIKLLSQNDQKVNPKMLKKITTTQLSVKPKDLILRTAQPTTKKGSNLNPKIELAYLKAKYISPLNVKGNIKFISKGSAKLPALK